MPPSPSCVSSRPVGTAGPISSWRGSSTAELKLPAAEHRCVELGALLHDVGKLSIPDRVLTKPAPLNELEWEAMRRHAALGERLLARIVQQADVLAVVRSHHERWDGRGYPDGKRAEEIPLAARVVAVADAFQAMIEPRPYREPRTQASALGGRTASPGRGLRPSTRSPPSRAISSTLGASKLSGPSSADAAGSRAPLPNTPRPAVSSKVRRLQDCTAVLSPSDGGPPPRTRIPPFDCRSSYEATLSSR